MTYFSFCFTYLRQGFFVFARVVSEWISSCLSFPSTELTVVNYRIRQKKKKKKGFFSKLFKKKLNYLKKIKLFKKSFKLFLSLLLLLVCFSWQGFSL